MLESKEPIETKRIRKPFFKYCLVCDKRFQPTRCQKICDKCKKKAGSKKRVHPKTKSLKAKP